MDFKYTQLADTENPIMLIDAHIGMDEVDGEGIMGAQFVREIMFLDTLNKKSIQIWICTPGGSCMDGEQMYNAILKTKTPVDTYNVGTVASIGGPIFLAGRNRYMGSWTKLMMHPASGGDKKSLDAYNASVAKMLSSRSFLTEEQVNKLMARTTWIMADEALQMGLCTEIENSESYNRLKVADSNDTKAYSKIINKLINDIKPKKSMKKVANKLNLIEDASEDAIVAAIEKLTVENKSKFDKFVDEVAEAKKCRDEATAKFAALEKDYIETKAKFDALNQVTEDAKKEEMKNKVAELVKNAVDNGKIVNEATVIADWTIQATANFDVTKNMIEKLPVNKLKPGKTIVNSIDAPAERKNETETPSINLANTSAYVAQQNAKNELKAKNRFKI